MVEKLDILAFAAHPDDVEISCAGTLIKHIALGHKVGIIDLTQGDLGTRGSIETRNKEAKKANPDKKSANEKHYFTMIKELTLTGFFTSEVGATKALRYVAIPGRYEGCVPYTKGDKAWA
jgi:hypothetical protein